MNEIKKIKKMNVIKEENRLDKRDQNYMFGYSTVDNGLAVVYAYRGQFFRQLLGYITAHSADDAEYVIDGYEFNDQAVDHGIDVQMATNLRDVLRNYHCIKGAVPTWLPRTAKNVLREKLSDL
ncbi:MAG: hypothetical protein K6G81_05355 [Lachnospiraceae bacterium]|nr:hypothetical protein [Lachnospiraceae bacterium]